MFDILNILGVDASRLNFSALEESLWQKGFAATCGSEKREGSGLCQGTDPQAGGRDEDQAPCPLR